MPRFIKATKLPAKWRRPHIDRYRRQLRDALMNPALTQEQKDQIKAKLAALGQEKPYVELAARAAAANPQTTSTDTVQELIDRHTKDELLNIAESEGAEAFASWTKSEIAEAIVASRS